LKPIVNVSSSKMVKLKVGSNPTFIFGERRAIVNNILSSFSANVSLIIFIEKPILTAPFGNESTIESFALEPITFSNDVIISDIPDEIKEHAHIKPKITEICIKFPYIFKDLSDNMKQDYGYILSLVSQNGNILQYLTKEQQNDYNIVMGAVAQNGNTLQHVSKTLKNNKDIVLTAVIQNSDALYYASEELKNNYAIVLTAVAQNGHALKYASDNLKENYNIVMTAYTQTTNALSHLNKTQLTKFKEGQNNNLFMLS
jgi:hypothetical protein